MSRVAISNIPLLSDAECGQVRDTLMALRGRWLGRHPAMPFYTLGAASYIDALGDAPAYASLAREHNPLLRQHFAGLYERVLAVLAQALGEPVQYAHRLGLPGFHIFLSAKAFEQAIGSIHFDLQYLLHDWQGDVVDLANPISFTLAIALPRHGGGLNTWEVSYADQADQTPDELARGRTPVLHTYLRGHLALHSGHLMHQLAPGIDLQPDDERITLQGHGVRVAGVWQLYW